MTTNNAKTAEREDAYILHEKKALSKWRVEKLLAIRDASSPEIEKDPKCKSDQRKKTIEDKINADTDAYPWSGIALSGGGIRSATFCLGILQALAKKNVLKNFDYISSVSGGGFIGSSLQWWWYRDKEKEKEKEEKSEQEEASGSSLPNPPTKSSPPRLPMESLGPESFPYGTDHPDRNNQQVEVDKPEQKNNSDSSLPMLPMESLGPESFPYGTDHPDRNNPQTEEDKPEQKSKLKHLREHGNYLAPGKEIDPWYGVSAVLRAVLLNLVVWIPLIGFLYLALYLVGHLIEYVGVALMATDVGREVILDLGNYLNKIGAASKSANYNSSTDLPTQYNFFLELAAVFIAIFVTTAAAYSIQTWKEKEGKKSEAHSFKELAGFGWLLAILASLALFFFVNYPNKSPLFPDYLTALKDPSKEGAYGEIAGPLVAPYVTTMPLFLTIILVIFFSKWAIVFNRLPERVGAAYFLRDQTDRIFGKLLPIALIILLICLVPLVFHEALQAGKGVTMGGFLSAVLAVAVGIGTIFRAYYQLFQNIAPGRAIKILLPVGAALFLIGIAFLGYYFALLIYDPNLYLGKVDEAKLRLILVSLVIFAFILARVVNSNQISLNRFYRDRLMEAYMPNDGDVGVNANGKSGNKNSRAMRLSEADSLYLRELIWDDEDLAPSPTEESKKNEGKGRESGFQYWSRILTTTPTFIWQGLAKVVKRIGELVKAVFMGLYDILKYLFQKSSPGNGTPDQSASKPVRAPSQDLYWDGGPYPLINTNVVLVNDEERQYRMRGGDNFVFSPMLCGSRATDFRYTDNECFEALTLATAMTASGAAVNPFTGYIGMGPARSQVVSIVMALLNLRLGYWLRNPSDASRRWWQSLLGARPNHLLPGFLYTLTKRGYRAKSYFLEITDGAHFDGLGIFELIRRRCDLIVVCDGEADKTASYRSLVSVIQRIQDDLKATILFEKDEGPERLVENKPLSYPSDALAAESPYFVATIKYHPRYEGDKKKTGKMIYMKARMIEDVSFQVKGYKGAHPDFPHESTSDQFFDPEQFEAYRELGYCTGLRMVNDLKLREENEEVFEDHQALKNLKALPIKTSPS